MRIPEIANELRELSAAHGVPRLAELADHMRRRRPLRKAPPRSSPVTPGVQAQIRALAAANPSMSQAEIGRRLNVNPGRVSETLRGFRK